MVAKIELKEIEKKAYKSVFQDGLWDIYFGILVLGWGLSAVVKHHLDVPKAFVFAMTPILAFLVLWAGKTIVTIPRMGMVQFSQKRKKVIHKLLIFGIAIFIVSFSSYILTVSQVLPRLENKYLSAIKIGAFFLIVLWIIASFLEFNRLYYFAALFAICFPLAELFYNYIGTPLDEMLTFGIAGVIILIVGFVFFIRFLQKYPKYQQEVMDNE